MFRLDEKLARIRAGKYTRADFIIADAKDGDMGPSMTSTGPKRAKDGNWTRYYTRTEFLNNIRAVIDQGIVDIMLVSASNLEALNDMGAFRGSVVKPAIRANDTTDIWVMRGAQYAKQPSRPFPVEGVIIGHVGAGHPGHPGSLAMHPEGSSPVAAVGPPLALARPV